MFLRIYRVGCVASAMFIAGVTDRSVIGSCVCDSGVSISISLSDCVVRVTTVVGVVSQCPHLHGKGLVSP